jgi:predicted secreted hydrolase
MTGAAWSEPLLPWVGFWTCTMCGLDFALIDLPRRDEQVVHHVQLQQAAHPVVREPLPHLGEEQDEQAHRVTHEGLL